MSPTSPVPEMVAPSHELRTDRQQRALVSSLEQVSEGIDSLIGERDALRSLAMDLAAALDGQLRGGGPTAKEVIALLARGRALGVAP